VTTARERWEHARGLFDTARALPPARRSAFLDDACPDAELRAEVDALLRAHAALQSGAGTEFLQNLDAGRASALLASTGPAETDLDDLSPGEILGRYHIVRRLGRGGMGVVYLAHDPRLDRPAALKLLPRYLSLDETARRRFEDEARAASSLDHPRLATVFEIGDAPDGRVFIAMAFYDGETLRDELERGSLPIPRSVALASQVAEGLAAAHRRGIVHRDVKPGNVIVTPDGAATLVDFGIAKVAGSALTQTGSTPGTVNYMSPEQTRGGDIDARADVWALGATLYEMLAGRRPFCADSQDAVIYAIRHDPPDPLDRVRPGVPPELARVVSRCLEKEPDRRYRDAGALFDALRALGPDGAARPRRAWNSAAVFSGALALLAALLVGAVALWPALRQHDAAPDAAAASPFVERRLAVLPLADESPDPQDDYFAAAVTDELISALSGLPGLRVIAHASVAPYQVADRSIAEIGRELGVGVVLSGRVGKSAERVRLSVALVDIANQQPLWAGDYDAKVAEVPAIQHEIGERVAAALGLDARDDTPRRPIERGPEAAPAYVEYLKGRYYLGKHDVQSFGAARNHFQRALDLDPTFALAWSGLADAFVYLASVMGLASSEAYPRARAAAEQALALDPDLAEAHAALGMALAVHYWDPDAAERHFRSAIELDPSSARAHGAYARYLRNRARFDEALAAVGRAQALDPLSAFPHIEEAIIFYMAGRYHEATAKGQRLLAARPDLAMAHHGIALNYAQLGRYDDALAALDRMDQEVEHVNTLAIRGVVFALAGREGDARQTLARLDELGAEQPVSAFHRAAIHVSLGEHDVALDLLEEGARERASYLDLLGVEPIFAPLRHGARFRELLTQIGVQR
jgi:eukaryotic-like serine/threonine-protein kinase